MQNVPPEMLAQMLESGGGTGPQPAPGGAAPPPPGAPPGAPPPAAGGAMPPDQAMQVVQSAGIPPEMAQRIASDPQLQAALMSLAQMG